MKKLSRNLLSTFGPAASLLIAFALAATGCGQKSGSNTRLDGSVRLNHEPLAGAEVELLPKEDPTLGAHSATTKSDGTFSIAEPAGTNNPLRPGKYVAIVRKISSKGNDPSIPGGGMGAVTSQVPSDYQSQAKSPLLVDVKAGDNVVPTFELKTQ